MLNFIVCTNIFVTIFFLCASGEPKYKLNKFYRELLTCTLFKYLHLVNLP